MVKVRRFFLEAPRVKSSIPHPIPKLILSKLEAQPDDQTPWPRSEKYSNFETEMTDRSF